jgi:hypothetical protein
VNLSSYTRDAPRAEAVAALQRIPLVWARALDTADEILLGDLLAEDVVIDMTAATSKIGLKFPVLAGRDVVVPTMIGAVGPLDTMHMTSNIEVVEQGDGYLVHSYALAQHHLPGQGPDPRSTRKALMGNRWTFSVRVTAEECKVTRFDMDCLWFEGDPTVLLAAMAE